MSRGLDHLVVAARTLDEGAAWVRERLGAECVPGGKHATMGTHNRLLSLGPESYLEVIAIDPEAPRPGRARWFELDTPAMQARIAKQPALVHWMERTANLEAELRDYAADVRIESFERNALRWRLALTPDGSFPAGGTLPTLIQWEGAHPCDSLPDSGILLKSLAKYPLTARFSTPLGVRTMP
ncbi:MAG TPA: VOC family protein [Usitatibacter sp.]|nr:VOC family protein [Usitatibacter sp.]